MIDYEKLKIAHELVYQLSIISNDNVIIQTTYRGDKVVLFNIYQNDMSKFDSSMLCISIDELIIKLKELTQPKLKYKVGDTVWTLVGSTAVAGSIKEIDESGFIYFVSYGGEGWLARKEESLYPSHEALIDAQIKHWTSLKNTETSTGSDDMSLSSTSGYDEIKKGFNHSEEKLEKVCKHESDGRYYLTSPCQNKCKKCGEFYR